METKDEKDPVFPEGFDHIKERLKETIAQVEQIDSEIKSIPKEKGPTPKYEPPYFVGRVVPGSRDRERLALQDKQHQIKMDAISQTEAATRGVDGKSGRIVRDKVREKLFPNPYRTLSREERLDQKSEVKEIEQSQDYMDAMLSPNVIQPKEAIQPQLNVSDIKDTTNPAVTSRLSRSLDYIKNRENIVEPTAPSQGPDQEIERD